MTTECMAATMGLAEPSQARMTLSKLGSASAAGLPNSRISAPPEKALPAPVSTMARTAGSALALSRPWVTANRVAWPKPLTGGLSKVITATWPCVS